VRRIDSISLCLKKVP